MVYTEDYIYVVCGSMAKWRDLRLHAHRVENCGIAPTFEIAPPYLTLILHSCQGWDTSRSETRTQICTYYMRA